MTDNEIIKALECCFLNRNCNGCSLSDKPRCLKVAVLGAIDLINRQQAEVEKENNTFAKRFYKEGIKEFAERLKPILFNYYDSEIDNLVKEMVGDNNG